MSDLTEEVQFSNEDEITEELLISFGIHDVRVHSRFKGIGQINKVKLNFITFKNYTLIIEEQICHDLFEYLEREDLIILIPRMKDRALFKRGLQKFLKLNEDVQYSKEASNIQTNNDDYGIDLVHI